MNRNRTIKTAAILTAGLTMAVSSVNVEASPSGGAAASVFNANNFNSIYNTTAYSGITSGATSAISSMFLATKNQGTNEVAMTQTIDPVSGEVIITSVDPIANAEAIGGVSVNTEANSEDAEFGNIAIANVESYVNVRSEPSEEAEVAGKLYANGAATVQEVLGDWIHITSGNCEGYIKAEYLIVGDRDLCLANSNIIAKVKTDGLNVRGEANTEAQILSVKETGDRLKVVDTMEDNAEWVKVSEGDTEGYVAAEYVDIGRLYNSVAETKEEEEARLEKERKEAEAKAKANNKGKGNSGSGSSGDYAAPSGGGGGAVASYACQFIGNPYVYGGTSLTNGADCSGFVMAVYRNFGVGLPHSSGALRGVGYEVGAGGMQPGDIVCYSGHVGIAIGGGQIVHASSSSSGIKISSAYYHPILAVRRVL